MKRSSLFEGLRAGVRRFFELENERVLIIRASGSAGSESGAKAPPQFVSAGRFGLVGLTGLKETLGPRWPALEERVRALAETLITRHLGPGDVFEVNEEGDYVVLFAQLDQAAAEFKCRALAREITQRLLGSDSPRLADVASVAVQISRDALASDSMEAAFSEAFAAGDIEISSDPACPVPAEVTRGDPTARPARSAAAAQPPSPTGPAGIGAWERRREPQWQVMEGGGGRSAADLGLVDHVRAGLDAPPEWYAVPPPPTRGAASVSPIEHRQAGSPHPEWRTIRPEQRSAVPTAAPVRPQPPSLVRTWRYAPVWDFKMMSLVRFRLSSGVNGPAAETTEEQALEAAAVFTVDVHGLSRAIRQLADLTNHGRRLSVICVLSESSVSRRSRRDQLLQLLREAPAPVRRLLGLEIRVGDFTATYALREFLLSAEALGVRCGVCAPLGEAAARTVEVSPGPCAVEVHPASEREALHALGAFGSACANAQRDSAAHGLGTRALVIGAVAAGVRFLSGAAVHGELEDLSIGLRFEPADLYRDLLVGRSA